MWFNFPPIFPWRLILTFLLFASICEANFIRRILGILPPRMYGTSKRDPGAEDDPNSLLEKRVEIYDDEMYYLQETMVYMALPYGSCNEGEGSDSECPMEYHCVCQQPGTSMCLPTTEPKATGCDSPYSGPTAQPTETTWVMPEPATYFATAFEQCGGTTQTANTGSWNGAKTICPVGQACACIARDYSECIPNPWTLITPIACPPETTQNSNANNGAQPSADGQVDNGESNQPPSQQDDSESSPSDDVVCQYPSDVTPAPSTATAGLFGQCGGSCWIGPTRCPKGASCYTEQTPISGAFAMCAPSPPSPAYKVRLAREAIDVPARVRARATAIHFRPIH